MKTSHLVLAAAQRASRLFPIIGDPVKYVQSPIWLTRTFAERGHNGICVPLEVNEEGLDAVMASQPSRTSWVTSCWGSRRTAGARRAPAALSWLFPQNQDGPELT